MGEFGTNTLTLARALSPVYLDHLANNQSLFSPEPPSTVSVCQTMQDEQQSPNNLQVSPNPGNISPDQSVDLISSKSIKNVGIPEENGSHNQMGISPICESTAVTTQSCWSTASADDTFLQGFQSLNGTVTFQQFPPAPNSMFSAGLPGMNVPPPQRRAITANHNNSLRQNPNIVINNAKGYNWNTNAPQQTTFSGQQNPATLSPWGNMQQQNQQRRSVPNINALNPVKKGSFHQIPPSSFIAPSKFRRSTSFPGQIHQASLGIKPGFDYQSYDDLHRDGINSVMYNQVSIQNYN